MKHAELLSLLVKVSDIRTQIDNLSEGQSAEARALKLADKALELAAAQLVDALAIVKFSGGKNE